MNTNLNSGSAKIYQFPTNPADRANSRKTPVSDLAPRINMAIGESWYHEAAVQEDVRARSVIVPLSFPRQ